MVSIISKRYTPKVPEKVRLALKRLYESGTSYAGTQAIAPLVDIHFETLRIWIKKPLAEGAKPNRRAARGLSAAERNGLTQLRRENRDLKQANAILKLDSAFLARNSTRETGDRRIHRQVPPGLRRRVDRPRAVRARSPDRPRSYRKARQQPPPARDITHAYLETALRDLTGRPDQMYDRSEIFCYLRRHGHDVAFCTVDRICASSA
ncbi:hypothetical protein AB0H71_33840 [Nocardia sp. NPDC050697]|uniref:hypothetical protein n=1 Tax=Nocardia sp. NPDC050697 TaxID=3155158 RepID=UPI0033DD9F2F